MNSDALIAKALPGTYLYLIDDDGVVFSQDRQELYALNTAAAYLWCLIEDGVSKDQVLRDYAATFDVDGATADTHISSVLEIFFELGLIELPDRTAAPFQAEEKATPTLPCTTGIPPLGEVTIASERTYKLLETYFTIRYSDIEQEVWVHPILTNFMVPDGAASKGSPVVLDLRHEGNEIFLYRDRQPISKCDGVDALGPLVKGLVWSAAVGNFDYFLNLHTGVLRHQDGCLLLPAAAGSGKSSTTAALVDAGFSYLSDEVALLTEDAVVRTLPLSLCFKSTGWDVVAPYFPEINTLPAHRRGDGKIVKYVPLPKHQCADATRAYPVKAIFFPQYTAGSPTLCEPLPKTQALDRLFRECVSIPNKLTEHNVSRLVDWIQNIECYTLEFSNVGAAITVIQDALDS